MRGAGSQRLVPIQLFGLKTPYLSWQRPYQGVERHVESSCPLTGGRSLANSKPLDDPSVTLNILALQVVQKASALSDQLQQSPARMMILLMNLEVIREVSDPLTQEGDLNLG